MDTIPNVLAKNTAAVIAAISGLLAVSAYEPAGAGGSGATGTVSRRAGWWCFWRCSKTRHCPPSTRTRMTARRFSRLRERGIIFPIGNTKPFFENIFRPWARGFAKAGLTANQVTTASIVLSMAAGGIVLTWPEEGWALLTVPSVLILRLAFDHIDGLLAREHGMSSHLGCLLNEHLNAVADVALFLPLAVVPGVSPFLAVPAAVLAVVIELTGAVAVQIGAERRTDGPMAKKPRAVVFGGLALALAMGVEPSPWLDWVLAGTVALMIITVFNRARKALHEVAT